jgi:hypothetical protein
MSSGACATLHMAPPGVCTAHDISPSERRDLPAAAALVEGAVPASFFDIEGESTKTEVAVTEGGPADAGPHPDLDPVANPVGEAKAAKKRTTPMSRADVTDEEWESWKDEWLKLPYGALGS